MKKEKEGRRRRQVSPGGRQTAGIVEDYRSSHDKKRSHRCTI